MVARKKQTTGGSIIVDQKPTFEQMKTASEHLAGSAASALVQSFVEKLKTREISEETIRASFTACTGDGQKRRLLTILSRAQTVLARNRETELADILRKLRKEFMAVNL